METTNIKSYKDVASLIKGHDLPLSGETEKGEVLIVERGRKDESLGDSFCVEVAQKNGWISKRTYWEDGTVEEMFDR